MKILITGGCGFIGHHFVEHFLKETDYDIVIVDNLTYAALGFDRVRDIKAYDDKRVQVLTTDITSPISIGIEKEVKDVNYILHLAAETHVDNSIRDPMSFVYANVVGTANMLQLARKVADKNSDFRAFQYFSTDEIFGPALREGEEIPFDKFNNQGLYHQRTYGEWDRYNSTNPYSASKAGGEELCLAWANTYGLPLFITHTMNCFGERQHPEKFIPKVIRYVMEGKTIKIHADPTKQKSGSRFYVHARNVANAVHFLMENFEQREKYNIVGEKEVSNLELALMIADFLEKPLHYEMVDFHSSRPGHDLRYALLGYKMDKMGWKVPLLFEESLKATVLWSIKPENKKWIMLED